MKAPLLNPAYLAIEELKDVRPPVNLPPNYFWLYVGLGIVLCGVLVWLGRWLWNRLKQNAQRPVITPQKPWELALDELLHLKNDNLAVRGEVKEYFFRLTGIIRYYIERRFLVHAPEMTTDEFLAFMKKSGMLNLQQKDFLRDFLTASDMVKFAKGESSLEEMNEAFGLAQRFVEETIPEEPLIGKEK